MIALRRTTEPVNQPVTLSDVKMAGRISTSAHDTMLVGLILSAVDVVENHTHRAIITQTWKKTVSDYSINNRKLPRPPLQSVTSVKYMDMTATQQTVSSSIYQIDTASEPGSFSRLPGQIWPQIAPGYTNPIEITFVAGYGDDATAVPAMLKQAIIALVAHWYSFGIGEVIPDGVKRALDNFVVRYELEEQDEFVSNTKNQGYGVYL